jgi:hypothetical protein
MQVEKIADEIFKEAMSLSRQDIQQARLILLRLSKDREVAYPINDKLKDVIKFLVNLETK